MRPALASRARQPSMFVSALLAANFQKPLHPAINANMMSTRIVERSPVRRRDCGLVRSRIILIQNMLIAAFLRPGAVAQLRRNRGPVTRNVDRRPPSTTVRSPATMNARSQQTKEDFWVFAYGSLMWRPGFDFLERRNARLVGAHRALCVYSFVHRGTPEKPGLVFGLDRGGKYRGIPYRVDALPP